MISRLLLVFLASGALLACQGTRKMLHEAELLEQEGMPSRAFESYSALYEAKGDARALVGMRRVAQRLLDEQFRNAQMQCMRGNFDAALTEYDRAHAYANQHRELELRIPAGAESQQDQCRADYVAFLYDQAATAVKDERYDEARSFIDRLRRLDRNHREAEYLALLCEIIPNYNLGKKAYELELYRDAYYHFLEVTRLDASYKDALALRDECMNKSKVTIAYLLVDNPDVDGAIETATGASIKNAILGLKDPFIELLDRENIDHLLGEQIKGMSGLIDEKTAIQAGRLTGARYLLTGEVLTYEPVVAQQRGIERKAYLGPTTGSKKVRYVEYRLGRGLDASYRYQLIDAETGRVHATAVVPFSERDNVVWADFEGDYTMLYPGEWKWQLIGSKEDVVNRDQRDELMAQFTGRRGPASEAEIRQRMMNDVAVKVANAVKAFRP
ncbi:MAG: CsgG/HfaB family protein [Flavobacteriales bacterium]|jgi:hypothetical protein